MKGTLISLIQRSSLGQMLVKIFLATAPWIVSLTASSVIVSSIRAPTLILVTRWGLTSHTPILVSMFTPKLFQLRLMRLMSQLRRHSSSKKRSCRNREAVRKYREKKKAHAASLVEDVAQLRAVDQQLMKRLQNKLLLRLSL